MCEGSSKTGIKYIAIITYVHHMCMHETMHGIIDNLVWARIMHTAVVCEPPILVGRRLILGHKCVEYERVSE